MPAAFSGRHFCVLAEIRAKYPPKTQNDPVLTVIIAIFEKFIIKKKLTKNTRTILKLENVMTGEKCYPTTSFSDMRL